MNCAKKLLLQINYLYFIMFYHLSQHQLGKHFFITPPTLQSSLLDFPFPFFQWFSRTFLKVNSSKVFLTKDAYPETVTLAMMFDTKPLCTISSPLAINFYNSVRKVSLVSSALSNCTCSTVDKADSLFCATGDRKIKGL